MSAPDGAPTGGASLHRRILAELEAQIVSGAWPPGHRLPFEQDLAAGYGCSRMTVNKVMTELVRAGLIERRRRAGSFVTRPHSQAAVLQIQDLGEEVAALGRPYRFAVLGRTRLRHAPRGPGTLAFAAEGAVLAVDCRHDAGAQPFCREERLIDLQTVPEAAQEPFVEQPPGSWLMRRVPWSRAEHTIRAAAADPATAAQLAIPGGTPCLVVERRTWHADRPVTAVRLTYPGDAHEVVARFSPGGAEPNGSRQP